MPVFHFHQPKEPGVFYEDPTHWEFLQTPLGLDGRPAAPVPLETFESPFYFDCSVAYLQTRCAEELVPLWNPLRQGEPRPEDVEACVYANVSECVDILTEDLVQEDLWVQVRACQESACSQWSKPTAVPSAPFDAMMIAGVIGIAILARFFKGPR